MNSNGKVVLITGASSGFGKETALLLSQHGMKVYGTSRNPSSREIDDNETKIQFLQLNVDNDDSVQRCVDTLVKETGRIDVLVNNAGYVLTGGVEETSIEEAHAQFETDFFGAVRVTKAILPTMRQQKSGQIINNCSMAAVLPVPFEGYYAAAKAALLAWTEALRHEVKTFGIKVSAVEPGFFRTNLGNTRKIAAHPIRDYDQLRERATSKLDEDFKNGADPKLVARTILKIIQAKSPKLEYPVGKEKRYRTLKRIMPESLIEPGIRRHWNLDKEKVVSQ